MSTMGIYCQLESLDVVCSVLFWPTHLKMYWAHCLGAGHPLLARAKRHFVPGIREVACMKVLVVEAEEAVLKSAGIMLNKLGYQVGLAPDCGEAFRMHCHQGPYDLVLIALKFVCSSSAGGTKFIDA